MTQQIEQFYCDELRLWQSRPSCAAMHERYNRSRAHFGRGIEVPLAGSPCVGCEIGAEHVEGRAPSAKTRLIDPLDMVRVKGPDPVAAKAAERRLERAEQEGEMAAKKTEKKRTGRRPAKLYEHNGRKQTLAEWADELGVHPTTLLKRIGSGWSVADALSHGATPPGHRNKKTPRKPKGKDRPPVVAAYDKLRATGQHLATPIEVLEAAGYQVEAEMETPGGLMVIVTQRGAA